MSSSVLYTVNKELRAADTVEFQNSWLFSIPIFDHLINKYASEEEKQAEIRLRKSMGGDFNEKEPLNAVSYLGFDPGNKKFNAINNEINNSTELFDRIGWELVNQQMFFSRDKDLVSDAIIELQKSIDNNADRFNEVAEAIRKIDGDNTPFFIWKNNTVDDGVERLFSRYDEELDDSVDMSIWEYMELNQDKRPFDLVIIKDEKMSFAAPESLKEKPVTLV